MPTFDPRLPPPPTFDPRSAPTPTPPSSAAPLTTLTLTMAGTVSDFTPAVLASIKTSLGTAAGISQSLISIGNVRAGSVVVPVTMPSSVAAIVVSQILSGTLQQLGGVTVEGVAIDTRPTPTLDAANNVTSPPVNSSSCWRVFRAHGSENCVDDGLVGIVAAVDVCLPNLLYPGAGYYHWTYLGGTARYSISLSPDLAIRGPPLSSAGLGAKVSISFYSDPACTVPNKNLYGAGAGGAGGSVVIRDAQCSARDEQSSAKTSTMSCNTGSGVDTKCFAALYVTQMCPASATNVSDGANRTFAPLPSPVAIQSLSPADAGKCWKQARLHRDNDLCSAGRPNASCVALGRPRSIDSVICRHRKDAAHNRSHPSPTILPSR